MLKHRRSHARMLEEGIDRVLVQLSRNEAQDEEVSRNAVLGLCRLCDYKPARPRLVEEGVLPLLVSNSMREGKHFHRGFSFVH